jgi:hypothetical protein
MLRIAPILKDTRHINKMDKEHSIQKILELLKETEKLIPNNLVPDLDPIDGFPDVPKWHKFESDIWKNGEMVRQILREHKSLLADKYLLDRIFSICSNRNAKRGRQSFIMLLWNKYGNPFADKLVEQLDDKSVDGHIIQGLNKMKASGYVSKVQPFCFDKSTWIRKQAQKYIEKYHK